MSEDSSLDSIPGSSSSSKDLPFQRWSQWLGSISEHDAELLQLQPEYEEFLTVMRRLEQTHITMLNSVGASTATTATCMTRPPVFLLQHSLLLRIYDFLECRDLVHSSVVCRRMYRLSHETARIRSRHATASNLPSDLQHVRLHEQWHGRSCTREYAVVPRPFVLLPKRVLVDQCGDPDLNGVYLCTAACGTGFCFTQPLRCCAAARKRCRIVKRYSGTRILWYMSKDNEDDGATYLYWAELMQEEQTGQQESENENDSLLPYPSLTSIMAENPAWQALPNAPLPPPVVELMD